jgi:hypothetical protein
MRGRSARVLCPSEHSGRSGDERIGLQRVSVVVKPEDHEVVVLDEPLFRLIDRIRLEIGGLVHVIVESRLVRDDEVPSGRGGARSTSNVAMPVVAMARTSVSGAPVLNVSTV